SGILSSTDHTASRPGDPVAAGPLPDQGSGLWATRTQRPHLLSRWKLTALAMDDGKEGDYSGFGAFLQRLIAEKTARNAGECIKGFDFMRGWPRDAPFGW